MPPKKESAAATKAPKAAGKAKKEKPAKKEKKKKDPNAPKRGLSGYMIFCNATRESVKADNPDMKVTDITRRLGELWKELTDAEKKKYTDLAEKDKKRYEKELAAYKDKPKDDDEGEEGEEEDEEDD